MKKDIRILEIGASSLLDFDFNMGLKDDEAVNWIKLYNNNEPKFYSQSLKLDLVRRNENTLRRICFQRNTFIFSTGNKGPRKLFHEYLPDEVTEVYEANLRIIFEVLPFIIKSNQFTNTPIRFIFMGSVAGDNGATYENHSYYAAMKAALRSLVLNLQEEYRDNRNFKFEYLTIPRLASRMTDETADNPESFRGDFMKLLKQ